MKQDHQIFFNEVETLAKVIDIGCGDGEFLNVLYNDKQANVHGIELDDDKVSKCLEKGLSVVQGDADKDLAQYIPASGDKKVFDYAILANTLQIMKKPKDVLENVAKVSNKILVSTPNFGYYKNRLYLTLKGKMPVTDQLSFQWYETPNIHFSTIKDLISLSEKLGLKIEKSFYIDSKNEAHEFNYHHPTKANWLGVSGVFVLEV